MTALETQIENILSRPEYRPPLAFGLGLRRQKGAQTLDVTYPQIYLSQPEKLAVLFMAVGKFQPGNNGWSLLNRQTLTDLHSALDNLDITEALTMKELIAEILTTEQPTQTYSSLDTLVYFLYDGRQKVQTPEEAYFKLQLISQRHVKPHGVVLDGAFGVLHNLAWTNQGPILPADFESERLKALLKGTPLIVSHVDKFPYLVNYHIPSGVRIVSGSQVRLGAYLGEGTTVMPAGYVNFNAGTEGNAMIEGRVSAGVMVGSHSDIGGGASIMGTLSGGNQHVISIGERCLLGANAGTGISLGTGCTIAAGLYIYAGMKVSLYNHKNQPINLAGEEVSEGQNIVKAMELSGRDYLLFIQDSVSGKVLCKPNQKLIALNQELHQN